MKDSKFLVLIWSMLVALVLISIPSVIESGPKMVGESYVDSDEFNEEMDRFYAKIGPVILNPLEIENVPEMIEVTADEIEEHRMRYGTLPEQIGNIHAQYDGEIENAEETLAGRGTRGNGCDSHRFHPRFG